LGPGSLPANDVTLDFSRLTLQQVAPAPLPGYGPGRSSASASRDRRCGRPTRQVEPIGFEPMTFCMPCKCATSCAKAPLIPPPARSPDNPPMRTGAPSPVSGRRSSVPRPAGWPPMRTGARRRLGGRKIKLARRPVQERLAASPAFGGCCSPGVAALSSAVPAAGWLPAADVPPIEMTCIRREAPGPFGLAGVAGFEPATRGFGDHRSTS
jgi:hypothetical protein